MKLTILVPIIGAFLIFSNQTVQILSLATFFENDIGSSQQNTFLESNLYYLYFGLCSLGFGSAIFSFFCPNEILEEPNRTEFVTNFPGRETPSLAKSALRKVLDIHFSSRDRFTGMENYPSPPEYTPELEGDFHNLMEELYTASGFPSDGDSSSTIDSPEVMLPSGYHDFTEFSRMLWMNNRASWPFTLPVFDVSPKFSNDIAFLLHKSLDYSKFRIRKFISLLYLVGFAVLLVPTAKTFLLLSWQAFLNLLPFHS